MLGFAYVYLGQCIVCVWVCGVNRNKGFYKLCRGPTMECVTRVHYNQPARTTYWGNISMRRNSSSYIIEPWLSWHYLLYLSALRCKCVYGKLKISILKYCRPRFACMNLFNHWPLSSAIPFYRLKWRWMVCAVRGRGNLLQNVQVSVVECIGI